MFESGMEPITSVSLTVTTEPLGEVIPLLGCPEAGRLLLPPLPLPPLLLRGGRTGGKAARRGARLI